MTRAQAIKVLVHTWLDKQRLVMLKGEPGTQLVNLVLEFARLGGNPKVIVVPTPALASAGHPVNRDIVPMLDDTLKENRDRVLIVVYEDLNHASSTVQRDIWQGIQTHPPYLLGHRIPNEMVLQIVTSYNDEMWRLPEWMSSRMPIIEVDRVLTCPTCGQVVPEED